MKCKCENVLSVYGLVLVMLISVWMLPAASASEKVDETFEFTPGWLAYPMNLPNGGGLSFTVKVVEGSQINVYLLDENNYHKFENSTDFQSIYDARIVSAATYRNILDPGKYHLVVESVSLWDTSKLHVVAEYGTDYSPFGAKEDSSSTEETTENPVFWDFMIPIMLTGLVFLVVIAFYLHRAKKSRSKETRDITEDN